MWSLDQIRLQIDEVDRDVVLVTISTPAGDIHLAAEVRLAGRTLYCTHVHAQGLHAGAVGRAGLNAIGRKLLVEANVEEIVIEGSTRTTGRGKGRTPRRIRFPRSLRSASR
jgi:hypothetical protein